MFLDVVSSFVLLPSFVLEPKRAAYLAPLPSSHGGARTPACAPARAGCHPPPRSRRPNPPD
eukprot:5529401-Pyramimonas_sp.AAC.1